MNYAGRISYEWIREGLVAVFACSVRTGKIVKHGDVWRYYPKGSSTVGDAHPSLEACKASLEED